MFCPCSSKKIVTEIVGAGASSSGKEEMNFQGKPLDASDIKVS
jgi:hypothetical protein